MPTLVSPPPFHPPRHFANGAQWLAALGGVPMERIIFDPWPGTATEADLLHLVEQEKRLCELIDGTLVEKPVGYWEALIATNVSTILGNFVAQHNLGAVSGADSTMRMKSGRVRLPDVAFVSHARLPKTREPIPTLSPDLAIEVLSQNNTDSEIRQKLLEYFQSGTAVVWIIDPASRTVSVYHAANQPTQLLDEQATLDGGAVLPGLSFAVAHVFRGVPVEK